MAFKARQCLSSIKMAARADEWEMKRWRKVGAIRSVHTSLLSTYCVPDL